MRAFVCMCLSKVDKSRSFVINRHMLFYFVSFENIFFLQRKTNVDGTIQNISQHHKRNLNDWNFAEHFQSDVFVQVYQIVL